MEKPETTPVYSLEKLPEEARARIKAHCPGILNEDGTQFKMEIKCDFPKSVIFDFSAFYDVDCKWNLDSKGGNNYYDLPFGYTMVIKKNKFLSKGVNSNFRMLS